MTPWMPWTQVMRLFRNGVHDVKKDGNRHILGDTITHWLARGVSLQCSAVLPTSCLVKSADEILRMWWFSSSHLISDFVIFKQVNWCSLYSLFYWLYVNYISIISETLERLVFLWATEILSLQRSNLVKVVETNQIGIDISVFCHWKLFWLH